MRLRSSPLLLALAAAGVSTAMAQTCTPTPIKPFVNVGGSWSATCIGAAVKIGGDVNQPATFDVTLQVKGKPAFTPESP